ncbi:MAG: ATP-binding cassette domain-containing protein [Gammaproteobacteria bacterium]|nr:ABC transporter ATP-binding protein [Gammaproteobacteria bacterium]NIP88319.1 ABC transporter ATP-binding protein [Gammaproteobacteria bacterium]NIR22761.1 ABC transporter ATP-binding protein [Gammaproteobacteria bacterium]NIS04651.1 ABC transporter ATP-binding protein [Gammaproteobacteria bacterium]NIU40507.1 ATP-binding cassette domain-containing protein [Gammaproteobacteria bacterium]
MTADAGGGFTAPRLELRQITKSYPAVMANDGVSLRVMPGEIHAVLGENGAGKSTLMKIIYGVVRADAGEMLWNGRPVSISNPAEARRLGIGMVFQHFSLFETLTVAENIALAVDGPFDLEALAARIDAVSERYGLPLDPGRLVHSMSVGERQRVEIVRCLLQEPELLIMDEPTSVLTPQAVRGLFETLQRLASEGCSVLYISHKLEELRTLCHKATVMRDGRVTGMADPARESAAELARLMVGRELPVCTHAPAREGGAVRLEIDGLSRRSDDPFGTDLEDIRLRVHGGEIVGIAGISGNGQQELLACLSGEQPLARAQAARIRIDGREAGHLDTAARRGLGLAVVPEDRLGRGVVAAMPLTDNALLTAHRRGMVRFGMVLSSKVEAFAGRCVRDFDVRCSGVDAEARTLSGGNLQKFIVGREILQKPAVLIAAQPTWGVDVGASAAIRQALIDLRDEGVAILVLSEELEELFEISDRIAVIARGRMSAARAARGTDMEEIGLLMSGLSSDAQLECAHD